MSPHYFDLLTDTDGKIFINYLSDAFQGFPEGGIDINAIENHRTVLIQGLNKYKNQLGIRAKYEWTAHYHNFVCKDFASRNPIPTSELSDEIYSCACVEAQKLLDHLIDIDTLIVYPERIKFSKRNDSSNLK